MSNKASILRALVFLTLGTMTLATAEAAEGPNLLIENVYIESPEDETLADLANIRIRDGVLNLVSKDEIDRDEASSVFVLKGHIVWPLNFLIHEIILDSILKKPTYYFNKRY